MNFLNYSIKLTLQTEITFWDPHFKNTLSTLCSRKAKPLLLPLATYPLMEWKNRKQGLVYSCLISFPPMFSFISIFSREKTELWAIFALKRINNLPQSLGQQHRKYPLVKGSVKLHPQEKGGPVTHSLQHVWVNSQQVSKERSQQPLSQPQD